MSIFSVFVFLGALIVSAIIAFIFTSWEKKRDFGGLGDAARIFFAFLAGAIIASYACFLMVAQDGTFWDFLAGVAIFAAYVLFWRISSPAKKEERVAEDEHKAFA